MANFPGLILTSAGRELQSKAQTGKALEFTRVGLGAGDAPDNIEALNLLVDEKKSLSIQSFELVGDGTSKLRTVLTNEGLPVGFFVKEIGVYAKDPDTQEEKLYSYSNSGEQSDFLPAEGGATVVEHIFDLITVVGNASNVTAVISDYITVATKSDVNEVNELLMAAMCELTTQFCESALNAYIYDIWAAFQKDTSQDIAQIINNHAMTPGMKPDSLPASVATLLASMNPLISQTDFDLAVSAFISEQCGACSLVTSSETTPQETTDQNTDTGTNTDTSGPVDGDGYVDGGTF